MSELLAETDGPVATFTLNRPERLNAITPALIEALDGVLADALADLAGPWDPAADYRTMCRDVDSCMAYPPARVWGSPTTAMWSHRLGLERAKRLPLTGDPMDGTTAAEWGFASAAYAADELDEAAMTLCGRIARLPGSQLQFMKMLVNSAFSRDAAADLKAAVRARDEPFGDYGSGPKTVAD